MTGSTKALWGLIGLSLAALSAMGGPPASLSTAEALRAQWVSVYGRLPLRFEANQGQTDGQVKYLARGLGYTLFLTRDEAVLALRSRASSVVSGQLAGATDKGRRTPEVIRLRLLGANPAVQVKGVEELPGKSNYFLGNDPKQWRTEVRNYAQVKYEDVYPGTDLVYYGEQQQLEYDFVLAPGADLKQIKFAVGADPDVRPRQGAHTGAPLRIDLNGDLVMATDSGEVRFHKPVVYQPRESGPLSVASGQLGSGLDTELRTTGIPNPPFTIQNSQLLEGHYVLTADQLVQFEVSGYDRNMPLVIDPVLSYATYLGGTGGDVAYGVAVDSSGNAYVTGATASANFPVTSAEQTSLGGNGDAFVTKFNSSGSGLIYSTYLGGNGSDIATAIALDSAGNAYVTGSTASTNFPTTPNVFQPTYAGSGDAYVTKLNATGSALVYSTYLGGSGTDVAQGIAVDSAGNAYLTGSTQSPNFPTANPFQIGNGNCATLNMVTTCSSDAFVTKVNPSATALVYSTYLGGSQADVGQAIAVAEPPSVSSGDAFVVGYTSSPNFPTQNALQGSLAGASDAFVTEFNAAGTALVFSTYLGGRGPDQAFGLALDASGSVYVTGATQSLDFPTTLGAFQTANNGQGDAFVTKLTPGGGALVYSTFLGGSGTDQATAIAVDSSGNAHITGFTQSSDFPTLDPVQIILGLTGAGSCQSSTGTPTACSDAFVAEINPSGNGLIYSTYLGGSGADVGQAITVDSSGMTYVAGSTASQNFPVISHASQATFGGSATLSNAFVAKVDPSDAPGVSLNPQQINFGNQRLNTTSDPRTVNLVNAGSAVLNLTSIKPTGDFAETDNCGTAVPAGGGNCQIQITFTPTTTGNRTDEVTISDNATGSPHIITVTGSGVTLAGSVSLTPTSLTFPATAIGSTSAPQVVQLINNGSTPVTLTAINITAEFSESNTCGNLPSVLNVGATCAFSVAFSPTGSGNRSGSLRITDNAASSPQTVALTGTGNPEFSLSANPLSTVLLIGTASTTFGVSALAPSSFTNSISLGCPSGQTCTFDPTSIYAGQSSTLTVTGLNKSTANPVNLTVTGTSGTQKATVSLSVFFSDFSIAASPYLNSVTAGQSVSYTVTVTPLNNFNQVVLLSCHNLPVNTTCTWSPPGLTLNGVTASTATVSVTTTSQTAKSGLHPHGGDFLSGQKSPVGLWVILLSLFALLSISTAIRRRPRGTHAARLQTHATLIVLVAMALLLAVLTGCSQYYYNPIAPANVPGTPPGTYTIIIRGRLGNNSNIERDTTVNLTVGPG